MLSAPVGPSYQPRASNAGSSKRSSKISVPPGMSPALPPAVVLSTSSRYVEAYERITRRSFADWPGAA